MALQHWVSGLLFLVLLAVYKRAFYKRIAQPPPPQAQAIAPQKPEPEPPKQPIDAFLVTDFEATCEQGSNFDHPSEIIVVEFPVVLMRWKDRIGGRASRLEVVAEHHTFVRPSWRPTLSDFCTELTSITQSDVDNAPEFPAALRSVRAFLVEQGVIEKTGKKRLKAVWCSDGPWDLRDMLVKQCFISKMPVPDWLSGDFVDIRKVVKQNLASKPKRDKLSISFNIAAQLEALELEPFVGKQHRGIDDARNIARILSKLATEVSLLANTNVNLRRRWPWMGKSGEILHDKV
ncbi:Exonuclease domain-containing protein [Mycena kentingensis (nom. inval.)]|nr:Exonuclease domain-containing protein [Mycena kentingensis (nom. inval.)]